jgi:chromosome segregation ATPase
MPIRHASVAVVLMIACLLATAGCQKAYYGTMETLGVHKRDILVDRVEAARDDQQEAKEEFQTALERFASVVNFDGGSLRAVYDDLSDQLETCEAQAEDVGERIDSIEDVSAALFKEWEAELDEYTNDELRRKSEDSLRDTRRRCDDLVSAMRRAEAKMQPVLDAFNDQVLFLKHNLNAQAIASLQGEVASIESDVASLIAEMNAAIAEADSFIQGMTAAEG